MLLKDYHDRHSGQTAAVLCGGPSLPHDLAQIPDDAALIGVNQHAIILPLDYIVFSDAAVFPLIAHHSAPKITRCANLRAQGIVWAPDVPDFNFSGPLAVWIADFLGFSRIVVCGVDLYRSERPYWHSLQVAGGRHQTPHRVSFSAWADCKRLMRNPANVEFLGPAGKEWQCA